MSIILLFTRHDKDGTTITHYTVYKAGDLVARLVSIETRADIRLSPRDESKCPSGQTISNRSQLIHRVSLTINSEYHMHDHETVWCLSI